MDEKTTARVRSRKPDAEIEQAAPAEVEQQGQPLEEVVGADENIVSTVTPAILQGPFRRQGFHIVDKTGRQIIMCGVAGDVARTGPSIAEAVVALLNK